MKLALGSAQFGMPYGVANTGGQVSMARVKKILAYSREVNIDVIDTAVGYGNSEETLGQIGVDGFNIITKIPRVPEEVNDVDSWIRKEIGGSIFRLGVDKLYGLMLHSPDQLLGPFGEKILQSFIKLKSEGIVGKIGVSVYSYKEFEKLFALYNFDIVQCPFNLVDRGLVTSGWLSKLKMSEVEVHSRSCFLQGLLIMSRDKIPEKFQEWNSLWSTWHNWLDDQAKSPMEACMSYVLSFSEIDKVVVGVDSKQHLEQIVDVTVSSNICSFPQICSENTNLINPANWCRL